MTVVVNGELWNFPHVMVLKVMGAASAPLKNIVTDVLKKHFSDFDPEKQMTIKPSAKGNFVSVAASIVMQNEEQCVSVYAELRKYPEIKMVL